MPIANLSLVLSNEKDAFMIIDWQRGDYGQVVGLAPISPEPFLVRLDILTNGEPERIVRWVCEGSPDAEISAVLELLRRRGEDAVLSKSLRRVLYLALHTEREGEIRSSVMVSACNDLGTLSASLLSPVEMNIAGFSQLRDSLLRDVSQVEKEGNP